MISVWRIIRSEVSGLTSFTFENVCYRVLMERHPYYTHSTLTKWWNAIAHHNLWRILDFYSIRSRGNLKLLHHLDVVGKTCEMARLFGIQFLEVITRGSQFRVESILLRLSKVSFQFSSCYSSPYNGDTINCISNLWYFLHLIFLGTQLYSSISECKTKSQNEST